MSEITVFYQGSSTCRIEKRAGPEIVTDLGEGFSPLDLFAASLAACLMTVLSLAADRLGVDVTGSRVEAEKEIAKGIPKRIGKITLHFFCPKEFSSDVREKLEQAGKFCPVHHSLHPDLVQEFFFHWGSV